MYENAKVVRDYIADMREELHTDELKQFVLHCF